MAGRIPAFLSSINCRTEGNSALPFEPQLLMVDGRLLARVHRRHGLAMEYLARPEDILVPMRGREIPFWETLGGIYAHHPDPDENTTYLRLAGGDDPRDHRVTISPGGGVVTVENVSYVLIRDLEIAAGDEGVHISGRGTSHVLLENCLVENARKRVNILNHASDVTVRGCEFRMNFHGLQPGAWGRGETDELAQKAFIYWFFKHRHGPATHSDDRSFHVWRGASRVLIENNIIHDGVQGIPIENATDVMVRGNTIRNLSSVGTTVGQGSVNIHLDGNHYYNCNISIRLHRLNQNVGHLAYVYRNRLSQPGDAGTHIFCHSIDNPDFVDPRITIYHNTFTRGSRAVGFPSYENMPRGVPGFRFINNVFDAWENYSRTREFMQDPGAVGVYAHNWLGGVKLPRDITPAWFGENVIFDEGARTWEESNVFILPEGHAARGSGIDLSRPFTINGVEYDALPGMEPGYFRGERPDMGAVQH